MTLIEQARKARSTSNEGIRRINMKKQALVAAACAVALTLGTAGTAFAAITDGVGVDDAVKNFNENNNSAVTTIKVSTMVGQIDATVPVSLAVAANAAGGNFSGVPSDGVYQIKNNSTFNIKVTDAIAAEKADWELRTDPLDANSTLSNKAMGAIQLILKPDSSDASVTEWNAKNTFKEADANWKVPAKSGATAGSLGFVISGSTTPLKKTLADGALSDAVTLTYTIAADTTTPATN